MTSIKTATIPCQGSVSLETLGPKPPYRVNATTRWGLAPSRLPLDMPSDAAAQLMAESKGAKRSGSKSSKRSGSKRPKSKEKGNWGQLESVKFSCFFFQF